MIIGQARRHESGAAIAGRAAGRGPNLCSRGAISGRGYLWWRGGSQAEGSDRRRREAIADGADRRDPAISGGGGMIVGGREGSPEEGSDGRWSGAMTGGGGCKAAIGGGGERSPVEESDRRLRGGITGGGERSQEKGSDMGGGEERRWTTFALSSPCPAFHSLESRRGLRLVKTTDGTIQDCIRIKVVRICDNRCKLRSRRKIYFKGRI